MVSPSEEKKRMEVSMLSSRFGFDRHRRTARANASAQHKIGVLLPRAPGLRRVHTTLPRLLGEPGNSILRNRSFEPS